MMQNKIINFPLIHFHSFSTHTNRNWGENRLALACTSKYTHLQFSKTTTIYRIISKILLQKRKSTHHFHFIKCKVYVFV